ncbi:hypothetical protein G6O69_22930 [Pseudenhygromyxa sp. WMMC2535]|uniref:lipase family protein n=1 Tax=Pseudenhygromyxa sp. WMMC2535 TaxID=2712867 RepID=UPI001557150C|nr:hypothetical protein [Pseudenhygromyxa sp. WMMC2535]NVB40712.1 hypothetical protein [Pseudenhygromyxa sp. WMMC2535]
MKIQLTYHKHSFVEYEINGTTLFFDPSFSRYNKGDWDQEEDTRACDIVAVTAGDFDLYLDALDVLEACPATMVGSMKTCRAAAKALDLDNDRFVALEHGEAARGKDFRLLGYRAVPNRFSDLGGRLFLKRPFDRPRFLATSLRARPTDPGRAYIIEIEGRRLIHLGGALNDRVKWADIDALDDHSPAPILVAACLLDNTDELIRAIRLLDPVKVFLYHARQEIYDRLEVDYDSLEEVIAEIEAAVGDQVEIVGLKPEASFEIDMSPVAVSHEPWNVRQQMTALSMLAYGGLLTAKDDPARVAGIISQFLDEYEEVLGRWRFVWGPAISEGLFADRHLFFIVQSEDRPQEAALVIRGTNPLALENIFVEVQGFSKQVPWAYGHSFAKGRKPKISEGIKTGIDHLLEMVPPGGCPGAGQTALEFLAGIERAAKSAGESMALRVTGHSLGGTLASTFALLLQDAARDESVAKSIEMPLSSRVDISCYPIAGFTAGNPAFASYADESLKNTDRIHNVLDAVPRMYDIDGLGEVPSLYEPTIKSDLISVAVEGTIKSLEAKKLIYKQIKQDQEGLPGTVSAAGNSFVAEMLWQHTEGYIELLDLEDYVDLGAILRTD